MKANKKYFQQIYEKDSIKNTNYDSEVIRNLQIDNPQQQPQDDYKENNEYFDPSTQMLYQKIDRDIACCHSYGCVEKVSSPMS